MFEVGKTYMDATGHKRKCIGIDGDVAYLALNKDPAFRWNMDGTGIGLGPEYNIPAPYPRPVIKWYPGETAPKDGSKFLAVARHGFDEVKFDGGEFVFLFDGSPYGKVYHWSPLPVEPE
jgi:hypothetical protein